MPAAARRLDAQAVAGLQRARRLRGQLVAVQQVAAGGARFAAPPGKDSWRSAFASEGETAARVNLSAFLRALYFQVLLTEIPPPDARETLEGILGALKRADIGFFDLA